MSKSFIAGVASGYGAVAVQAVTGVLLVPYLLSTHGVGLEGFGQIATIQALAAALGVLLDGHRLHTARQIALAATEQQRSCLTALLMVTAASCIVLGGVSALLGPTIVAFAELGSDRADVAWRLACGCFVIEQLCYVLESHLHSARRSVSVNVLGATDAVTRAILTVALFSLTGPAIHWFFLAALISLSAKFALLMGASRLALVAATWQRVAGESRSLARSLPLALNGIAPFLVFRLTIVAGNKFLGSEQAGVLALLLVTVRTYLNQAVFSAMRPLLIARLAGRGWIDQPASTRQTFLSRLRQYQLGICALGGVLAAAAPFWVALWLGASIEPYVPYFAVLLVLFAAEVAYGVPYYWLVANGHAQRLAVMSGVAGALVSTGVVFVAWASGPMIAYVAGVAVYLIAYILAVRHEFRRRFGVSSDTTPPDTAPLVARDASSR